MIEKLITFMINDGQMRSFWPLSKPARIGDYRVPCNHARSAALHVRSDQMRRPLAIMLVLFFALGPLQGVLQASDESRLPACCRRNGAHHCAMNQDMRAALERAIGSTPAFTAPATCPSFPGFVLGILTPSHALAPLRSWAPVLIEQPHSPVAANAVVIKIAIDTRSGRAPPATI